MAATALIRARDTVLGPPANGERRMANTVFNDLSRVAPRWLARDGAACPAGYRSLVSTMIVRALASELPCCTSG